ncbi:hypothetical protein DRE_04499 [Drechslerella stenobrocha 248]|uniref:glutathione-specific gamma-glutamylcyclotransferase n=1 Tax=Drechslerella stenobrocha 248 TaxID=1043628 RepID=W7I226_9PEZI|nr:hypothetical protein DRE_04499 [Drechslerella stenobrocha 248]
MSDPLNNGQDFWIFGYGEDHRGTPEAPGRVVTLVEQETSEPVWGAAYLIAPPEVERIKAYLDLREINGYTIHRHPVHHNLSKEESTGLPNPIPAILYIGTPDNPQFVGPPKSTRALAQHILDSRGPSGENKEYLYNLYTALEQLAPDAHDSHVSELATTAAEIEGVSLKRPK